MNLSKTSETFGQASLIEAGVSRAAKYGEWSKPTQPPFGITLVEALV